VAASYALNHLEQVRGLVLLSPSGVVTESWQRNWQQQYWKQLGMALGDWVVRSLFSLVKLFPWKLPLSGWLQKRAIRQPPDATAKILFQRRRAEIQAEFLQDRLNFLSVPVLILCGDRDRPQTLESSRTYANLCPRSQLNTIPDADESVAETSPDLVVQEIRQFLQL